MSQQTEIRFNKLMSFLCIRPPPFLRCIKESKNKQNRRNDSERGEVQAEQEMRNNIEGVVYFAPCIVIGIHIILLIEINGIGEHGFSSFRYESQILNQIIPPLGIFNQNVSHLHGKCYLTDNRFHFHFEMEFLIV